jgi:hypothetical protein
LRSNIKEKMYNLKYTKTDTLNSFSNKKSNESNKKSLKKHVFLFIVESSILILKKYLKNYKLCTNFIK